MLQFLPGTDYIFSGYSSMPKEDNLFGGGNFDAHDLDDYNVLQRDMQVDGGLRPVSDEDVLKVRRRAAQAVQAVFRQLDLPPVSQCRGGSRHPGGKQHRHAGTGRGGRPGGCRSLSGGRQERTGRDPCPGPGRV